LEIQGGITTAAEALTLNGTGISTGGALRNISGNNNYAGAITLGAASRINSDSGTLTLSGGIGGNFAKTFGGAGNTTVTTTAISGSGGLTKDGNGTLRFGVTNTYTGNTTVSVGTLLANATSATSSGAVSVSSGGTLGGTGSIAPTGSNGISVSGVLAPGDGVGSVGTLTFNMSGTTGTATMASGSSFAFELGLGGTDITSVGSSDMLSLTGAASGDFTFNNNNIDLLNTGANGFYKLFDTSSNNANTWVGLSFNTTTGVISSGLTFTNLTAGKTGTLLVGTTTNGGSLGDIYLSVIPEPSAALLAGLGSCLLFRRRRNPS
jgi:autotransporter-associated beta strand protein